MGRRGAHATAAPHQHRARPPRTSHHTTGLQPPNSHPRHLPRHTNHGSRLGGQGAARHLIDPHRADPSPRGRRLRQREGQGQRQGEEKEKGEREGRANGSRPHLSHQAQPGGRPRPPLPLHPNRAGLHITPHLQPISASPPRPPTAWWRPWSAASSNPSWACSGIRNA